MLEPLTTLLGPAVLDRLTLAVNHVLAAEPAATTRLQAHAGQTVALVFENGPPLLPAPPPAVWQITPAGLLEVSQADSASAGLRLGVDAGNPMRLAAQWLAGDRSGMSVQGDVQLAATAAWLMDNLRWDVEDDLARVFGDGPGRQLAVVLRRIGEGLRTGLSALLRLAGAASTQRPSA